MNYKEYLQELLKDPEFKKEWERFDLWFEIGQWWLEFRCKLNRWMRR